MEKALVVWEYDNPHDNVLPRFRQLIRTAEQGVTLLYYSGRGAAMPPEEAKTRAEEALHETHSIDRVIGSSIETLEQDIIETASTNSHDILIKSHATESSSLFQAGPDSRLLRELNMPLLLCANHKRKTANAILATVDISGDDPLQDKINRQVLNAANGFAQTLQKELHVAYIIAINRADFELEFSDPLALVRKHEADVTNKLQQLLQELNIKTSRLHISAGLPEMEIKDIAKVVGADLVTVGSVGRKGLKGLLLGNTAERLLKNLRRDLLIIKP